MRVAIAQMDCEPGEVGENCAKMTRLARQAKERGCRLVLFPEMSDLGYDLQRLAGEAAVWDAPDSAVTRLRETARELELFLVAGVTERVGDDVFNTTVVIGADGEIRTSYRKTHLFVDEQRHFSAGNEFVVIELDGVRFGIMTCYDLRFPEFARRLALNGAEVILLSAAWPLVRHEHWYVLTAARAIENQVYLLASNRSGSDNGLPLAGDSRLFDPYGTVLGAVSAKDEGLIVGEVDAQLVERVRGDMPVFADRRKDLYS